MEWAYATRPGAKRRRGGAGGVNQDAVWVSPDGRLCVVADGGSWRDQRSELASGACVARAAATYAPDADAGFTHGFVQALNTELLGRIVGGERLGTTTLSVVHACPDGRVLATALGDAPIFHVQATLGHASVATTSKYLHARPTDSSARYLGV